MNIIHFLPDSLFSTGFIERVSRLDHTHNHTFILYGENKLVKQEDMQRLGVICWNRRRGMQNWRKCAKYISHADKIIIHGLFLETRPYLLLLNFYCRIQNKICVWFIWSADLYVEYPKYYRARTHTIQEVLREFLRRKLVKKIKWIVGIEGDYLQAKQWYPTEAKYKFAMYAYDLIELKPEEKQKQSEEMIVLLGHSGSRDCRHLEMLPVLAPYKDRIRVICPMSYPANNEIYAQEVLDAGKRLLGESFQVITDILPYEEYYKLLANVDIVVFNNARQQAMGNITSLLYMGKKIYLSKDNTIMGMYQELGATIFDIEDIKMELLEPMSVEAKEKNTAIAKEIVSDEAFIRRWKEIFDV